MDKQKYDVVIVGAGAAGLTAGAYLSKAGYSVCILEKDEASGGLLGSYTVDGVVFDKGARGIIDSGIVHPMMRQLGLKLDLRPNPITMAVENESITLNSTQDVTAYGEMLKKVYPESSRDIDAIMADILKVMKMMEVIYGIENPLFLDRPYDLNYVTKTLLPWMVRFVLNIRKTHQFMDPIKEALRKHTTNEGLIHIIAQHFFEATPSFFALSYFSLYLEYQYPKDSTQSVINELERVIKDNGNTILHQHEVHRIDVKNRTVYTSTQAFSYDELIWAGDTKFMYQSLDKTSLNAKERQAVSAKEKFLADKLGADSILGVNYVLDIEPQAFLKTCGPHAFYTPDRIGLANLDLKDIQDAHGQFVHDQEQLFAWVKAYLKTNTYEISIPALRDEGLAPKGKTGLMASILFDYRLAQHIAETCDFNAFKKLLIDDFTDVLVNYLPMTKKNVLKALTFTPLTIHARTNNFQGSATGWSFANKDFPVEYQFMRVSQSVKTPMAHITQAGQWTFNPAGVPVAILTAKLAADAVEKALKKRRT